MKLRLKNAMSVVLFVLLIFPGCFALLAEDVPQEVFQAAQEGICDFSHGIHTAASLDNLKLHHGFQVYSASPGDLLKNTGLSVSLAPSGVWRLVVLNEGKPVSLMTIDRVQGQWKAVAIGGAQLAVEVNKVMEQWPAAQGYNHRFTRIYQARTDLIEISHGKSIIGFVPLTATRQVFGMEGEFDAAALLHDSEIFPALQKTALETIANLEVK